MGKQGGGLAVTEGGDAFVVCLDGAVVHRFGVFLAPVGELQGDAAYFLFLSGSGQEAHLRFDFGVRPGLAGEQQRYGQEGLVFGVVVLVACGAAGAGVVADEYPVRRLYSGAGFDGAAVVGEAVKGVGSGGSGKHEGKECFFHGCLRLGEDGAGGICLVQND